VYNTGEMDNITGLSEMSWENAQKEASTIKHTEEQIAEKERFYSKTTYGYGDTCNEWDTTGYKKTYESGA